jgi:hypothetical protein
MTKEEYAAERKRIASEIEALKKLETEIQDAYIEEHCPYNGGDLVKVTLEEYFAGKDSEHMGVVNGCWADMNGELNYSFRKAKKDGTASDFKLHTYGRVKSIELIEKAKTN